MFKNAYNSSWITHLLILAVIQSSIGFVLQIPGLSSATQALPAHTQSGCGCCGTSCMCIKTVGACYCGQNKPSELISFKSPECSGTVIFTFIMKSGWFLLLFLTAISIAYFVRQYPRLKILKLNQHIIKLDPPPPRLFS